MFKGREQNKEIPDVYYWNYTRNVAMGNGAGHVYGSLDDLAASAVKNLYEDGEAEWG